MNSTGNCGTNKSIGHRWAMKQLKLTWNLTSRPLPTFTGLVRSSGRAWHEDGSLDCTSWRSHTCRDCTLSPLPFCGQQQCECWGLSWGWIRACIDHTWKVSQGSVLQSCDTPTRFHGRSCIRTCCTKISWSWGELLPRVSSSYTCVWTEMINYCSLAKSVYGLSMPNHLIIFLII